MESKIVDPETCNVAARGESGKLCTWSFSAMLGYRNYPDATAEFVDEAGWMDTGDLVAMDEEEHVNIVGRMKDVVIRGGGNVYPREFKGFLYGYPAIDNVQVIGVPDVDYGEDLCAWVRLREDHDLTIEGRREFCKGRIAHYRIPRYVRIADDFPMTVTGEVQRLKPRYVQSRSVIWARSPRLTARESSLRPGYRDSPYGDGGAGLPVALGDSLPQGTDRCGRQFRAHSPVVRTAGLDPPRWPRGPGRRAPRLRPGRQTRRS